MNTKNNNITYSLFHVYSSINVHRQMTQKVYSTSYYSMFRNPKQLLPRFRDIITTSSFNMHSFSVKN